LVRHHLIVEDPFLGFGNCHSLGEQSVHLDHFDTAGPHLLHEVEVVAFADLHPHHVVVEEPVAIARRQALVCGPRGANHDFAQLADLGVHAKRHALGIRHDDLPYVRW
jgi:hypothetical protein